MKRIYRKEEGDIGIATLILFIAIIIVAAIASSLIIYVGITLREQGEKVAADATAQITSSVRILNILGDRDIDGKDPTIVSVKAPIQKDTDPPTGGKIINATVKSTNPLAVEITWNSAVDTGTGMGKEVVYRVEGDYSTLRYVLSDMTYVKIVGKVIAVYTDNFTSGRSMLDFTVEPGKTYGYAIIGYDRSGNSVLYSAINQTVTVSSGTRDTTPPSGNIEEIKNAGYGVLLSWTASDSGSGLKEQIIYRSRSPITSSNLQNATRIAVLNSSARSYIDYPPENGTWYYAIEGIDNAGNNATYTASVDHINVVMVDSEKPSGVRGLRGETGQYSIHLEWKGAIDNKSGIKGYYIYRSDNYLSLTTPEIFNRKPYAFVTRTYFDDYSYTPYQMYYYAVISVDNATNTCDIIYPQNSIQVLEIKLALGPGSKPVDFNTVIVEMTDGKIDVSLKLNSSGFGVNGSDSTHYGMEVINDPTGEFMQSYILDQGAVVKMYINARRVGLTLTPQSTVEMKIMPGDGIPIYKEIRIPPIMLNRYVQIY